MKLRQAAKLDKKNETKKLRKFAVDVMSANCNAIVIFSVYGQFGAIRKPDSGRLVYKTYIFSKSSLMSYKNWKQNENTFNTALTLLLWVKVPFLPKNADLLQKNAEISKIKTLALKVLFSQTKYLCVLTYQISSF